MRHGGILVIPRSAVSLSYAMVNQRKTFSLLGETAREVGVLILVFVPLDLVVRPAAASQLVVILLMSLGCLLIFGGILLEAWQWKTPR